MCSLCIFPAWAWNWRPISFIIKVISLKPIITHGGENSKWMFFICISRPELAIPWYSATLRWFPSPISKTIILRYSTISFIRIVLRSSLREVKTRYLAVQCAFSTQKYASNSVIPRRTSLVSIPGFEDYDLTIVWNSIIPHNYPLVSISGFEDCGRGLPASSEKFYRSNALSLRI